MMSDEEENTEAEGAEGSGAEGEDALSEIEGGDEGGGKKKLVMLLVPLFVLLGVGGGLYFSGFLDPYLGGGNECVEQLDDNGEPVLDDHGEPVMDCPEEEEEHAAADDHGGNDGHGGDDGHGGGASGSFVPIPTMIVNLNNPDGTSSYLRLTVQIELENPSDAPKIEAVMPRVVDQFQTYLRELRPQDLRGSAGLYRLQMELLWRVNQAASPVKVKDVLFQEILIQ